MPLALGDACSVEGEDAERRDEEHRSGAGVGCDDDRRRDRDARIRRRDDEVHPEHLAEHPADHAALGDRDRSGDTRDGERSGHQGASTGRATSSGRGRRRVRRGPPQGDGDATARASWARLNRTLIGGSRIGRRSAPIRAPARKCPRSRTAARRRTAGRRGRTSGRCAGTAGGPRRLPRPPTRRRSPTTEGGARRGLPAHRCHEEHRRKRREDESVHGHGDGRRHTSAGRDRVVLWYPRSGLSTGPRRAFAQIPRRRSNLQTCGPYARR